MPGAHDQKHFVIIRVFGPDRLVNCRRAVDVFLVPETVHEHRGHFQGLGRKNLIHRLLAPESVVARMFEQLLPEADLLKPVVAAQLAGAH